MAKLPRLVGSALVAVLLGGAPWASAQARAGVAHLAGGLAWPHQDGVTGEESQTYVTSPGGTTTGWTVGGGVRVAPWASVDVEIASTGVMKAREPSRYDMTFNEERRDHFVTVALRFTLPVGSAVDVEPLAGVAFATTDRWSQTERSRPWLPSGPQVEVDPRIHESLPTSIGMTLGVDARIGGERIAVVPSLRVHYVPVSDELAAAYPGGCSSWTLQPGVVLRLDF